MSTSKVTAIGRRRAAFALAAASAAATAGLATGCAVAAQPHMHNALDALQLARRELQLAAHNKGGHRVKAIELVDAAILQVRRGIADGAD